MTSRGRSSLSPRSHIVNTRCTRPGSQIAGPNRDAAHSIRIGSSAADGMRIIYGQLVRGASGLCRTSASSVTRAVFERLLRP
nr:hypothetical protein [uncultured bacterium]